MELTALPLPLEIWAATPAATQALVLAQQECIRDLEARLGQGSANSSRPPSSDPPQSAARPKPPPSARKRGGQPDTAGPAAPTAGRAGGRGGSGRPGGLPALSTAVSGIHRPPARPGLATPGGGVTAALEPWLGHHGDGLEAG